MNPRQVMFAIGMTVSIVGVVSGVTSLILSDLQLISNIHVTSMMVINACFIAISFAELRHQ